MFKKKKTFWFTYDTYKYNVLIIKKSYQNNLNPGQNGVRTLIEHNIIVINIIMHWEY